jgi:uncharacterized protein YejL (UPF0352 family)
LEFGSSEEKAKARKELSLISFGNIASSDSNSNNNSNDDDDNVSMSSES